MKRILFSLLMALWGVSSLQAAPVILTYEDYSTGNPEGPKTPIRPWIIEVTNNFITMSATSCDYILSFYDEEGEIAYSVYVPVGTTQVILPTTLSGSFEIRFATNTYYY